MWCPLARLMSVLLLLLLVVPCSGVADDGPFYFALARMLAGEGNFREAQQAFQKAIDLAPDDPYLRVEYAEFLSRVRRLREAARQAKIARELAPEDLDVLRVFGQVYLALAARDSSAIEPARQAFEIVRQKTPHDVPSMMALSQIYLRRGQAGEAAEVLEEVMRYHPNNPQINRMMVEALIRAGEGEKAKEVLRDTLRSDPLSLQSRLDLAKLQSEEGDHSAAIETLQAAPPEVRSNIELRLRVAIELHARATGPKTRRQEKLNDLEAALEQMELVLTEHPTYGEGLYLKGLILAEQTRSDEAIEILSELHELQPGHVRGASKLAALLEEAGRGEDAGEVLSALAERLEEVGQAEVAQRVELELALLQARLGDWDRAEEFVTPLLAAEASELRLDALMLYTETLAQLGREEEALDTLRRYENGNNQTQLIAYRRAEILFQLERYEELLPLLKKLLKSVDADLKHDVLHLYVEVLERVDRGKEGLELLERHMDEVRQSPRLLFERAELLFEFDQEDEAHALLADFISNGERQRYILVAQFYYGQQSYDEMIGVLDQALELPDASGEDDFDSIDVYYMMGAAYERTGQRSEAEVAFRRVLEIEPDHSAALNYLGYMWAETGENLEEALQLVIRAVALEPDNGAYVDSLGWAHYQLGHYEEARHHLERAAELIPDDATILEHLGDTYVALGNLDKARESYERAVAADDENVDVVQRKLSDL